jgi:hypothetical protein
MLENLSYHSHVFKKIWFPFIFSEKIFRKLTFLWRSIPVLSKNSINFDVKPFLISTVITKSDLIGPTTFSWQGKQSTNGPEDEIPEKDQIAISHIMMIYSNWFRAILKKMVAPPPVVIKSQNATRMHTTGNTWSQSIAIIYTFIKPMSHKSQVTFAMSRQARHTSWLYTYRPLFEKTIKLNFIF